MKDSISIEKIKNKINQSMISLKNIDDTLVQKINYQIANYQDKLIYFSNLAKSLNPDNIVKRGYSIIYKNGQLIKSIKQVDTNDKLDVKLKDGTIKTKVYKK